VKRYRVSAFVFGLVFAAGLCLSGMTKPEKVIGFLDVTGAWDPSLAFVMGAALLVGFVVTPRIVARSRPIAASSFHVPPKAPVDARLLAGAVLFGVGWGLAGYCPGPAIVGVGSGLGSALVFVVAMVAGVGLFAAGSRAVPALFARGARDDG
jgi:uncharacterized membrane protein YedE/YeeE